MTCFGPFFSRFAWMATLFPPRDVALAMSTLSDLVNHYRITREVWAAFIDKCGDPLDDLRMLAALPALVITEACALAQLPDGTTLSAIQASQIGLVYRLARRILSTRAGEDWDSWVDQDPWSIATTTPPSRTTSSSLPATTTTALVKERKLKMTQVLDQADDSEFVVETEMVRSGWLQRVITLTGSHPQEEEEPTLEQVSALHKRAVTQDLAPYTDFGVWVPFGARALKASKFRSFIMTADGYVTKELQGPACFLQWRSCFRVFLTACLMLNLADQAILHAYEMFIERLTRQYPGAWHLIYQADDQARNSHITRMRTVALLEIRNGGTPPKLWEATRPWNAMFRQLPFEEDFWREQVHGPALAWLAHGGRGKPQTPAEAFAIGHLRDGLNAVRPEVERSHGEEDGGEPVKKNVNKARREARKRRIAAEREELEKYRKHSGGDKKGGHAPRGQKGDGKGPQKCFGWNNGNGPCANLAPGQQCVSKVKREHKCTICDSPGHPSKDCPQKK